MNKYLYHSARVPPLPLPRQTEASKLPPRAALKHKNSRASKWQLSDSNPPWKKNGEHWRRSLPWATESALGDGVCPGRRSLPTHVDFTTGASAGPSLWVPARGEPGSAGQLTPCSGRHGCAGPRKAGASQQRRPRASEKEAMEPRRETTNDSRGNNNYNHTVRVSDACSDDERVPMCELCIRFWRP
jgi:hypothetical protein